MADTSSPLYIGNEMAAFDRKDRAYYDKFTDEEKKQFSTYLMLRYGASTNSRKSLINAYYLRATNENVNKHFFDLNKHPKLQWLMCTTVSPMEGNQFHYWLAAKKKEGKGASSKIRKFVSDLYPNMKSDELDLFLDLNTEKEIKDLAKEHGLDDLK